MADQDCDRDYDYENGFDYDYDYDNDNDCDHDCDCEDLAGISRGGRALSQGFIRKGVMSTGRGAIAGRCASILVLMEGELKR